MGGVEWRGCSGYASAVIQGEPEALAALDESPLWSAPFGLRLLATVKLMPGLRALDIGCGTGFPLLELASRLGSKGRVMGLDPWSAPLDRARQKAKLRGIRNIDFAEGTAEIMPFEDGSFDCLVSNNGLNNVSDISSALAECARVARPRAQLVMTANLPDSFKLFYELFEALLEERQLGDCVPKLHAHISEKRKTGDAWHALLEGAGFRVRNAHEDAFTWSFLNGTAMFEHWNIRLAFLPAWMDVVPVDQRKSFFEFLEGRLNRLAWERGGLHLEIPFICLDALRS